MLVSHVGSLIVCLVSNSLASLVVVSGYALLRQSIRGPAHCIDCVTMAFDRPNISFGK